MQALGQLVGVRHAQRQVGSGVERAHDVVRLGGEDVDAGDEVEHALQPGDLGIQELARALEVLRLRQRQLADHLGEHRHARAVVEARDLRDGVGMGDAVADGDARHGERLAQRAHHHEVAVLVRERNHALAAQRELDGALVHHHPGAGVEVGQQRRLRQQAAGGVARVRQHGGVEHDAVALGCDRVGHGEAGGAGDLHHAMPRVARGQRVLHRSGDGHAHGAGLVGLGHGAHHVAHGGAHEERFHGQPELTGQHAAQRVRLAVGRVVQLAGGQRRLHRADERRGRAQGVGRAGEVDPVHLRAHLVGRGQQLLGQRGHASAHAQARVGISLHRRHVSPSPHVASRLEARNEYPSTSSLRPDGAW